MDERSSSNSLSKMRWTMSSNCSISVFSKSRLMGMTSQGSSCVSRRTLRQAPSGDPKDNERAPYRDESRYLWWDTRYLWWDCPRPKRVFTVPVVGPLAQNTGTCDGTLYRYYLTRVGEKTLTVEAAVSV